MHYSASFLKPLLKKIDTKNDWRIQLNTMNNEKRVSLWYNDKRTEDNQPHLRGSMELSGRKYWVSLWIQTDGDEHKRNDAVLDNCIKMLMRRPVVTGSIELAESNQGSNASKTAAAFDAVDELPVDDIPF